MGVCDRFPKIVKPITSICLHLLCQLFDETGVWLFASLFSKINSSASFRGVKDCDVASCERYAALCKQWRDNNSHWPSLSCACRSLHVAPRPDNDEPCDMACQNRVAYLNNMLILLYQDRFSVSFIHVHCSSHTSVSTNYAKGQLGGGPLNKGPQTNSNEFTAKGSILHDKYFYFGSRQLCFST